MLTRRTFVKSVMSLSVATVLPCISPSSAKNLPLIDLRLLPGQPLATIPKKFVGLGYEESSVATAGLLSEENRPYVQLVRNLGPTGVLRAGGIVADFTSYLANGNAVAEPKHTVVTQASLKQLRGFLDAVNWNAIWSVNFGRGTLDDAMQEAKDVAALLGPRLLAIELGNEVENYSRGIHPLRQLPYNFEDYLAEYNRWHAAMLSAVPGLRFAAPDTAGSIDWVERMAAHARGDVQLLTTHYYRGDQKLGTRDQLLRADPDLKIKLERLRRASIKSGVPWRMCETNSFFGGGRPGLSDTLVGALWTLDYMLLLARHGCAGVNIETGVNQLGFVSSYSPIQDDGNGHNTAGAPYYGMLAFASAITDAPDVLGVDFDPAGMNLTAYALGRGDRIRTIVLINKTPDRAARISLRELPIQHVSALRLTTDVSGSQTSVVFGGAAVNPSGIWKATDAQALSMKEILVPALSAVVLRTTD